jgi:hypothetical protein
MTLVTVQASLVRPVWNNGELLQDRWFIATLCDAYFGFLTFYIWVVVREHHWGARIGWFVAIMLLGNFAMATYALIQLARLDRNRPLTDLLQPKRLN